MKALIVLLALLLPQVALARDPLQTDPKMYSLLYENDEVRVMKVVFKPGEKIVEHSHPNHYVVVKSPGKLKISKPDGTANEVDLAQDQVLWIPAETHSAQNVGTTQIELIVNEMKPKKVS